MKKTTVLILLLFTIGIAPVRAVAPTAEQKIDALELSWLNAEKANLHAFPQEPGLLVDSTTGAVFLVLDNAKNSYALDAFNETFFIKHGYPMTAAIIHLHPTQIRRYGTAGAWLTCWNCPLSEGDIISAAWLNMAFIDAVYVGSNGHFYRSRMTRMTLDGWKHLTTQEGRNMSPFAFARKYPQYVKYTLERIDG